ncbi:hypothetical protein DL766_009156 [Monosporascus sp. MC13-8B]|uniref:Cytochrome P450 n=1 Tax=Monosporascus cannonballus TaxID=155416 RepID=A0ABY0HBX8_9PEZI|nr:hypothetical protein DL763_006426 [Monosporascus cannonballus]RYO89111.1 hypothetical protein DL762_003391 [Monosporascus cannonballus]RYP16351.1 hypothetical protein DL766_009156 [Monosporascus sp. MC13-8B]
MDSTICAVMAMLEALVAQQLIGVSDFMKAFFILFGIQYLGVKCYRIFLYPKYFSPLRHIPGPQALNLVKAETPTALYIKWMREHPDVPLIRFLTFGNGEVIVCNSPDSFKEVLQTKCYSFRKSDFFRRITSEFVGYGVVTMEGEAHRAHRKMITPVFSLNNIRRLEPVFQNKAKEVTWLFDRAIDANDGGATSIDCTDTFTRATLDAVGVALFGVDLSGLKEAPISNADEKSRWAAEGRQTTYGFHEAYDGIFGQDTLGKILMFANAFVPVRWMPLEANRKFLFATKWLNDFLTQLVRNRTRDIRAAYAAGKYVRGEARDLLTFIIEESLPGGPAEEITEREIVGDLLQLMAAGHDTSANILSWSVYIMATKQDIQDKLREEMLRELGEAPEPAYDQIEALPYLDNFTRETLRVYASATTTHRQAVVDETICGIFIPKDTTFDIVPHVTLMNPLIWGDDVDEFDPTRWDRLSEEARSPYAFSTFSNGPRVCLGRSFAFREIKIIVVEMVRNYRFLAVEGPFTVENPSLTLRPRGLRVLLEKRS